MTGQVRQAERCLNNATEHFVKLGNESGEAAALCLLAELYQDLVDRISTLRCLERVIQIDLRYQLPQYEEDHAHLTAFHN